MGGAFLQINAQVLLHVPSYVLEDVIEHHRLLFTHRLRLELYRIRA